MIRCLILSLVLTVAIIVGNGCNGTVSVGNNNTTVQPDTTTLSYWFSPADFQVDKVVYGDTWYFATINQTGLDTTKPGTGHFYIALNGTYPNLSDWATIDTLGTEITVKYNTSGTSVKIECDTTGLYDLTQNFQYYRFVTIQ